MGLEVNAEKPLLSDVQSAEKTDAKSNNMQSNFFINPIKQGKKYHVPIGFMDDSDSDLGSEGASFVLSKYADRDAIIAMIKSNPKILKMLNDSQISLRINMDILKELRKEHLQETKKAAMGIIANLPQSFRSAVDVQVLKKAAILHDFGKVLIPAEIVNKRGRLNEKEFAIMQKHAEFGYELLKTTDLDNKTLELIKNHHQNSQKTGYPYVEESFVSDINSQILATADVYTALREKRSYKEEMCKNKALSIIHKQMKQSKIHPYVFKALVDYANGEEYIESIKNNCNLKKGSLHPYVFKTVVDNPSSSEANSAEVDDNGQIPDPQSINSLCA